MEYPRIECKDCQEGIDMCKHRPCWGTVKQLEKIIDSGYAHKLMLDYWVGGGSDNVKEDIMILSGANNGCEGKHAKFSPIGACGFLVDDKCSIHAIRPAEGAWSCCKDKKDHEKWRKSLVKDWDTDKGRALVERWKKMVGLKEEKQKPSLVDGLKLLEDLLKEK